MPQDRKLTAMQKALDPASVVRESEVSRRAPQKRGFVSRTVSKVARKIGRGR